MELPDFDTARALRAALARHHQNGWLALPVGDRWPGSYVVDIDAVAHLDAGCPDAVVHLSICGNEAPEDPEPLHLGCLVSAASRARPGPAGVWAAQRLCADLLPSCHGRSGPGLVHQATVTAALRRVGLALPAIDQQRVAATDREMRTALAAALPVLARQALAASGPPCLLAVGEFGLGGPHDLLWLAFPTRALAGGGALVSLPRPPRAGVAAETLALLDEGIAALDLDLVAALGAGAERPVSDAVHDAVLLSGS